jgi:hypothetical protein
MGESTGMGKKQKTGMGTGKKSKTVKREIFFQNCAPKMLGNILRSHFFDKTSRRGKIKIQGWGKYGDGEETKVGDGEKAKDGDGDEDLRPRYSPSLYYVVWLTRGLPW